MLFCFSVFFMCISLEWESGPRSAESSLTSQPPQGMIEHHHIKASKSMDLGKKLNNLHVLIVAYCIKK